MGRLDARLRRLEARYGLDPASELALQESVLAEAFARTSSEVMDALGEAVDALGEGPEEEEITFDALRALVDPTQARLISLFQTEYLAVAHDWGLTETLY